MTDFSHSWKVSIAEAIALQHSLANRVEVHNEIPQQPRHVVGADISPPDSNGIVTASAVVMTLPELELVEGKCSRGKPEFEYIPGLLSFRETPLVLSALAQLQTHADFLLADGQGIAHPRRFGLACHLGLLANIPAIGCAKSNLTGSHAHGDKKWSWTPARQGNEVIGAALRTRKGVHPVYVSIGHLVTLESAIHWVLACCRKYKIPEPARLAHRAAAGILNETPP